MPNVEPNRFYWIHSLGCKRYLFKPEMFVVTKDGVVWEGYNLDTNQVERWNESDLVAADDLNQEASS